mmetsp:Transcript_5919/g.9623  ORF Transcript_5919/g.9623 Transcript_5919/m.9623 type:complete len:656 (-) Transcript_5919:147-2114(-)
MSSYVTRITAKPQMYRELIQSLYTFDWNMEDRVVVAYINLLGQVVSSNPIFLIPSLQMLVKNFLPSQTLVDEFSAITDVVAKSLWTNKFQEKQSRIHRTIQNIIHVVPTAQLELFPIAQEYFPHKRHHVLMQTEYIAQLLVLCTNFPSLQLKILDIIVAKCLEIDVEIVIEESGDVLIRKDEESGGLFDDADDDEMFALDDNNEPGGGIAVGSSKFPRGAIGSALKIRDDVTEMADKLDSMLCVVMKFILERTSAPSLQDKIFNQFFNIFESRILSTYKSKFVQYIIFILCKNYPQRGISFANRLVELFTDTKNHHLCRQSSVLYLASFLARANFIPQSVTNELVSYLMAWCVSYVSHGGNESSMKLSAGTLSAADQNHQQRTTDDGSDVYMDYSNRYVAMENSNWSDDQNLHKHETFYSAVQTCCYIVCFHGVSLGSLIRDSPVDQQNWEVTMTSKYQPIKFCLQSVRVEFLRLSRDIDMFPSVHSMSSVPSDKAFRDGNQQQRRGLNPLDSFFPFDPCLLSQVHDYVVGGYVAWEGIRGLDYHPSADSDNIFLGEGNEDEDDEVGHSLVSSMASSITSLSLGRSIGAGQSYGAAMSLGVSFNAASSLASTYSSGHHQQGVSFEQGEDVSSSPYNIRVLEKRTRQYSVGSTGSW